MVMTWVWYIIDMSAWSNATLVFLFSVSFLFNWLGFLLSLCLSNTEAGRCGALSGLGLSIVKWVVIAKVSEVIESAEVEKRHNEKRRSSLLKCFGHIKSCNTVKTTFEGKEAKKKKKRARGCWHWQGWVDSINKVNEFSGLWVHHKGKEQNKLGIHSSQSFWEYTTNDDEDDVYLSVKFVIE